jgi:hypothetical protein
VTALTQAVRERPILFSGEMIRALLREDSPKTQTRRVMKPQPYSNGYAVAKGGERDNIGSTYPRGEIMCHNDYYPPSATLWRGGWLGADAGELECCPYGQPGDRLWVREAWETGCRPCPNAGWRDGIEYRADDYPGRDERDFLPLHPAPDDVDLSVYGGRSGWRPSIHMPRWASRITLEITDVRVERVQDISEDDARAEGVTPHHPTIRNVHRLHFSDLWERINGPRGYGWDANPWVWCITFRGVEA